MSYSRKEGYFASTNGVDSVAYYIYSPETKPKAIVQLCHGMCEYTERYEQFIEYLCDMGFAVIAHDHVGHGNSVSDMSDLGYFGLKDGWLYLIKDLRHVQIIGMKEFGKLPHYFIGHSMGSLVVRCFLAKYSSETDGAVILGTSGRNPAVDAGILLADYEIMMHGVRSRSHKLNDLIFGICNSRIDDNHTPFDWLTRDEEIVEKYCNDEKCNFIFTSAGFRDIFMLLSYCSENAWYKKVRPDLPMLIMSGTEDPIGSYGKGVMQYYKALKSHGFTEAEIRLWDGCRHELINELNKGEFYDEVNSWLEKQLEKKA